MMKKLLVIIAAFALTNINAQKVNEPKDHPKEWSQSYEPFRIAGNMYYVGTYDLASYLIVTNKGNILINSLLLVLIIYYKSNFEAIQDENLSTETPLITIGIKE
jgi:metallo-beta-lactamase class B